MANRNWTFNVDGQNHQLQVRHGYWLGRREIRLDGRVVEVARRSLDTGSIHQLVLPGHQAEIQIHISGASFAYLLVIDGLPYLADEDTNHPGRLLKTIVAEQLEWAALGRALGLTYWPRPGTLGRWHHRLLGWWRGYPVSIQYGQTQERVQPRLYVVLRYASPFDLQSFKREALGEPELAWMLKEDYRRAPRLEAEYVELVWPYFSRKQPAAQLAQRMQSAFEAIARRTGRLPAEVCETVNCKSGGNLPAQWVVFNGYPMRVCSACQVELAQVGEQNQKAYESAPSRLGRGFVVGLLVAAAGAVGFAASVLALRSVSFLIAVVIFGVVHKTVEKAGSKVSGVSLGMAATMAAFSVTLGTYLSLLWPALRSASRPIDVSAMAQAISHTWQVMASNPRLIAAFVAFNVLGILVALVLAWLTFRSSRESQFHPNIEIIDLPSPPAGLPSFTSR